MAIRDVLQLGNPLLRTPAALVEDPTSPQTAALVEQRYRAESPYAS
jgi:peptide deformylase